MAGDRLLVSADDGCETEARMKWWIAMVLAALSSSGAMAQAQPKGAVTPVENQAAYLTRCRNDARTIPYCSGAIHLPIELGPDCRRRASISPSPLCKVSH
jgi:hypothetical protein